MLSLLESFLPFKSWMRGICAYLISLNERDSAISFCLIVLIEWSLPLITWVIWSMWSSTKLDKMKVGDLSDLAIEKSSIFSEGIFIFPNIKSSYSKNSFSRFTLKR